MERQAAVAGRFYPGDRSNCESMLTDMFKDVYAPAARGAIVPHAGWVYSGWTAAKGIAGLVAYRPETIVIFGSVHLPTQNKASLFANGSWQTPIGNVWIDEELAKTTSRCQHIEADAEIHRYEHSIEVEVPLIHWVLPESRIVPIMVRPGPWAEEVGQYCVKSAQALKRKCAYLGSTDMTHYGPTFGFEPQGPGEKGICWAKQTNDRRLIEMIKKMDTSAIMADAKINHSACGAGSIAATIGAMRALSIKKYVELEHTTSADREREHGSKPVNSVGYHAGIFIEEE